MKVKYAGNDCAMHLDRAILIYGNSNYIGSRDGHVAIATVHNVRGGVILPGNTISRESVEELARALEEPTEREAKKQAEIAKARFISADVVAMSDQRNPALRMIAWRCPSQYRPIYFNTGNRKLDALSGKSVRHPALLFIKRGHELWAYALATDERPEPNTKLHIAPYFNVWENAKVCVGTAKIPDETHHSLIRDYERGFFQSAFTHSNMTERLTAHPEGHLGLWREMTKDKPFPAEYLNSNGRTLGEVL